MSQRGAPDSESRWAYAPLVPSSLVDDVEISLDELTEQALAADPDTAVDDDAVPFATNDPSGTPLLPEWYMPVPQSFARTPARRRVALLIVGALLLLNGFGLCVTYGYVEIAW